MSDHYIHVAKTGGETPTGPILFMESLGHIPPYLFILMRLFFRGGHFSNHLELCSTTHGGLQPWDLDRIIKN